MKMHMHGILNYVQSIVENTRKASWNRRGMVSGC